MTDSVSKAGLAYQGLWSEPYDWYLEVIERYGWTRDGDLVLSDRGDIPCSLDDDSYTVPLNWIIEGLDACIIKEEGGDEGTHIWFDEERFLQR
jgi:hypothetical protein